MSVSYTAVGWNPQKKAYDLAIGAGVVACIGAFSGATLATHPGFTAETLVIRASAVAAMALLHVVLCIGPLARLDRRFLPLLYNRRHLGVTMFLLATLHAVFATIQFHGFTDANPIASIFTAYARDYNPASGFANFPFEAFGALSLAVLFLMAATSHDFWLKNLGASVWKSLHMLVYFAYGSVLVHVALGALQSEQHPLYPAVLGFGFVVVCGLHWAAYRKEAEKPATIESAAIDGFEKACRREELREGVGKTVLIGGERVALFLHSGKVFALSNVCRHQGGPIGEGRILDGCVTCPWHGWNYRPEDGKSPPPFKEVLPTYDVCEESGTIYVKPGAKKCDAPCAEESR